MRLKTVGTLSVALLAFVIPVPVAAQSYSNACDSSSYVVLPGGQCIDLAYLELLGDSRASRQQIERLYQQQFDANVELETIYSQYPQLNDETEEEREERYRSLAETSLIRDDAVASNEEVESSLLPIHVRTMATMRDAFVYHLYDSRSLSQE